MQLLLAERGEAVHLHTNKAPVNAIERMRRWIEGPRLAPGEPSGRKRWPSLGRL